jgi:hypothetical protein
MGEAAEGLRQDIEETRSAMSGTLEAIGDRVSPGRILERRRNRMTGWVRDATNKVMGTADGVTTGIGDGAHQIRSAPSTAVDGIASGTRGTPIVAGSIAFGVGVLIGSIVPPSRAEQRLGEQARSATEPLKAELQEAGREMVDHLREPVQNAVDTVKETAQESAEHVRETAGDSADEIRQQASS